MNDCVKVRTGNDTLVRLMCSHLSRLSAHLRITSHHIITLRTSASMSSVVSATSSGQLMMSCAVAGCEDRVASAAVTQ